METQAEAEHRCLQLVETSSQSLQRCEMALNADNELFSSLKMQVCVRVCIGVYIRRRRALLAQDPVVGVCVCVCVCRCRCLCLCLKMRVFLGAPVCVCVLCVLVCGRWRACVPIYIYVCVYMPAGVSPGPYICISIFI
jgi:hypothetical protein